MKRFLILLAVALPLHAFAEVKLSDFLKAYADHALEQYTLALKTGQDLQKALNDFTKNPSAATFAAAKSAWTAARTAYSPTEAYRLSEGPIDSGDLEGLLNSWPLDESAIDYVEGNENSGIINDVKGFPVINAQKLISLNGVAAEDIITTGYHAIEFLLWGQDLNLKPGTTDVVDYTQHGNRSYEDYVVGVGKNADRRATYLNVVGALLVTNLQQIVAEWTPSNSKAFVHTFLLPKNEAKELQAIIEGLAKFSGEELAHERMYVALDTGEQEEEHSCFSDQTDLDIKYNFQGVEMILNDMKTGPGLISLIRAMDPSQADAFRGTAAKSYADGALAKTEKSIEAIPVPFDEALQDPTGQSQIEDSIAELENVMILLRNAKALFPSGVTNP